MDIIKKYSKTHHVQKQNYLTGNVSYNARISCDDEIYKPKLYKGICETIFEKHYGNHKKSFNAEKNKNDSKLSTQYWKLANKKLRPRISQSIKGKYKTYNPNSKRFSLCLHKKMEIVDDPEEILLNKRSKVMYQCCHGNKYKLKALMSNKKDRDITLYQKQLAAGVHEICVVKILQIP